MRNTAQSKSRTEETAKFMPMGHERHLQALGFATDAEYRLWCTANGLRTTSYKTWVQRRDEMRLQERRKLEVAAQTQQHRHIRSLGFSTLTDYSAWCATQRLGGSLRKTGKQLQEERALRSREWERQSLKNARLLHHRPDLALESIFQGETNERIRQDERFVPVIAALGHRRMKGVTRERYLELLRHALKQTRMMKAHSSGVACPHYGVLPSNTFAHALSRVAELHAEWRRPLTEWRCPNSDPLTQFRSLVHHLFGAYPTPNFLISAWFEPNVEEAETYRLWWLTLAAGDSLRNVVLPIALSQKERHAFLNAPDSLTVSAALRWAQARGRGATVGTAKAILQSRLRDVLLDEPFWDTVVRFFVNHKVPPARIPLIVDYLYARRFRREVVRHRDGVVRESDAQEPEFTMKGRTLTALLRQAEEWHREVMRFSLSTVREWTPMPCTPLEIGQRVAVSETETGGKLQTEQWRVQEILNTKELSAEGEVQRNCVASYHGSCLSGASAIWSVRRWSEAKATFERVLTVEVHPKTRQVVQIRGKCNRLPTHHPNDTVLQRGVSLLKLWAEQNGLAVADYA